MSERFIAWLRDGRAQAQFAHADAVARAEAKGKRPPSPLADDALRELSDKTIRNILGPLRACLATAPGLRG